MVLITSLAILLLTGRPSAAIAPPIIAALLYGVWTQPLRYTVYPLVFIQCFFFEPPFWRGWLGGGTDPLSILLMAGNALTNIFLNKVFGISALSLTGQELAYPLLFVLITIRAARGVRIDSAGRQPQANVMLAFLAIEIATVGALEIWGAATGGNMRSSLFQMRQLLWLPLQTFVLSYAMRDLRDFRTLALTIICAALLKVSVGLYLTWQYVWSKNIEMAYMTGHSDSVLFVAVVFVFVAAWVHERSWRRLLTAVFLAGFVLFGIYVNSRRLAYVNLVGAFAAFYPLIGGPTKRRIKRGLLAAVPAILVYLALARTHTTGIFAPGAQLVGIANVADGSTQWRELENVNLIYTLRQQRILGSGWGHEFVEFITLPTVADAYKEYRLVAHNSVLWLLGISGIVGFTLLWMPIVVGVYLAARSYRFAETPFERTAAASAVAVMVCYVSQAWGDIGIGASNPTLLLACALAMSAKLAIATGAWPSDTRLFAPSRFLPESEYGVK
ncbi:MAG: O-antigen ligase family protein [Gemmatimonadaceae bacterium]